MTKKITIFIAFFLLIAVSLTQAQLTDRQRRLQNAQERTTDIIQRARAIVAESGSIRARNLLQAAVRLHSKSVELSDLSMINFMEQYMLQSEKLTFSARGKAQRSIAITRQALENEDNVRRRLEAATERLRRAEESIDSQSPQAVHQMLQTARQKLERAREFYLDHRLKPALQMLLQTEQTLGKMKGRLGGLADSRQRYQHLLEMFLSAQERINSMESLGGGQALTERLQNMDRLLEQAQTRAELGDYDGAVKLLQKGVGQIKRLAERAKAPNQVRTALERTRRQAEQISEQVAASSNRQVQKIYSDIGEYLNKAGQLADREQFDRAAIQIQAAHQLLVRLTRMLGE